MDGFRFYLCISLYEEVFYLETIETGAFLSDGWDKTAFSQLVGIQF